MHGIQVLSNLNRQACIMVSSFSVIEFLFSPSFFSSRSSSRLVSSSLVHPTNDRTAFCIHKSIDSVIVVCHADRRQCHGDGGAQSRLFHVKDFPLLFEQWGLSLFSFITSEKHDDDDGSFRSTSSLQMKDAGNSSFVCPNDRQLQLRAK